jgi:hypothetical protein
VSALLFSVDIFVQHFPSVVKLFQYWICFIFVVSERTSNGIFQIVLSWIFGRNLNTTSNVSKSSVNSGGPAVRFGSRRHLWIDFFRFAIHGLYQDD